VKKVKKIMFVTIILVVFLTLIIGIKTFYKVNTRSNDFVEKRPTNVEISHKDIVEMKTVVKGLKLNDQGFWEADFGNGYVFIYIPEGKFIMGSKFGRIMEKPQREVYLDDYWMAKTPVTVGQFKQFIQETNYVTDAENGNGSWQYNDEKKKWTIQQDGNWKNPYFDQEDNHPVVSVSWNDSMAFCTWLSEKLDLPITLPSGAQFEKGARGTDGRIYPWGNEKPDGTRANYADASFATQYGDSDRISDKKIYDGFIVTSSVGSFPAGASPYGLLDMAGNVWEWNYDVMDYDFYEYMSDQNPINLKGNGKENQERENRGGGSWTDRSGYYFSIGGHDLLSMGRSGDEQNSSDDHLGFRICIDEKREINSNIE